MMTNTKVKMNTFFMLLCLASLTTVHSWSTRPGSISTSCARSSVEGSKSNFHRGLTVAYAFNTEEKEESKTISSVEETTEKYGLEAGLFESLKKKDGGISAKSLLAKYGVAYLATSIPLAIVSFGICYLLVSNGVDVAGLLNKVGIQATSDGTEEKVGTFAIAYAAHKAASPIRFPPTVILTPVVAKLIGKEPENDDEIATLE